MPIGLEDQFRTMHEDRMIEWVEHKLPEVPVRNTSAKFYLFEAYISSRGVAAGEWVGQDPPHLCPNSSWD